MYYFKSFIFLSVIMSLTIGCQSNAKRIEEVLRDFTSHPIVMCTKDCVTFCSDSTYNPQTINDAILKYVCYIDSSECSPCILKNAYKWNDYISMFKKYGNDISFLYVISSKNYREIISQARESGFCQAIYIDTLGVFAKRNSHIPKESMYHVFLLDNENHIILVGNPLTNKTIENHFMKIVTKRLEMTSI